MTDLLLDTHVVIWWFNDDPRMSDALAERIESPRHRAFVSSVTAFEVATKRALGKLRAPDDLGEQLAAAGFDALPVTMEHGFAVGALPFHHRDPFDRILVAQARCEGLMLVTADRELAAYDVPILAARS